MTLSRSYAVNGLNQYSTAGAASFTYDANGNLTGDGTASYTYDAENRLLTGTSPTPTTLQYDPLGRLWRILLTGKTIEFVYDGDAMVIEYNGSVMHRYVHGDGADDPLIWYVGPTLTDRRSLQADAQGSIVSIADASGAATNIDSYDEYGIPAAGNIGRFQYTGQMWIGQLGMYYYKARMYSSTLGRFMQVDPIGYKDQSNLYAYVGSDPINHTDPSGKVIDYYGTKSDKLDLKSMVRDVAASNSELGNRYKQLSQSRFHHSVRFANNGEASSNRATSDDLRQNVLLDSFNGKGIGSTSVIERNPPMLRGSGIDGKDIAMTARDTVSHELFAHAVDRDSGRMPMGIDPRTHEPSAERNGVDVENIYRKAMGEDLRVKWFSLEK